MRSPAITRRTVLKSAGGFAVTAIGMPASAFAGPEGAADCALTIFADYAEWVLAHSPRTEIRVADRSGGTPDLLIVSDVAPSLLADFGDVALVQPAALHALPLRTVLDLLSGPGPVAIAGPVQRMAAKEDIVPWGRLAEVTAGSKPSIRSVLVDLGGKGGDGEAVRAGAEIFRRSFADLTGRAVAVSLRERRRFAGLDDKTVSAWL